MYLSPPIISIIIVLVGVIVAYLSFKKGSIKDIKKETKENTILTTKLDFITQGVNNIQIKMENQDNKFNNVNERLIRVEEYIKRKEVI